MKRVNGSAPRKLGPVGQDRGSDKQQNAALREGTARLHGAAAFGHKIVRGPWGWASAEEWADWKWQYRNRIRSLRQLASVMHPPALSLPAYRAVTERYPLAVTPYFLSLMDPTEEGDPLRRQCFPDPLELAFSAGEDDDPLGEQSAMPVPGLIHRFPDRCLIIAANACAVYCRHCNRKRIWRDTRPRDIRVWLRPMIDYIARTPSLREVILSGGDPLLLSDGILDRLLRTLRAIPHVEVLRIGSRAPVTLPMRVTAELVATLKRYRPLWFNTQFNHAREITPESERACERLLMAGIPVSSQSVLLKGINDDYESMRELLIGLERISVRPYYLFHCDPVRGVNHFRVDVRRGMEIMERLRRSVSGLALPRYVQDCPGGRGKIPLQRASSFNSFDKIGGMD